MKRAGWIVSIRPFSICAGRALFCVPSHLFGELSRQRDESPLAIRFSIVTAKVHPAPVGELQDR